MNESDSIVVIWEDPFFPSCASTLHFLPNARISFEERTLDRFINEPSTPLRAHTIEGKCVTINACGVMGRSTHRFQRNYDLVNDRAIPEEELPPPFEVFSTKFYIDNGFIGDCFIDEMDPLVDDMFIEAPALWLLCRMTGLSEESKDITLFENEFVSINLLMRTHEKHNEKKSEITFSYALGFRFAHPVHMSFARQTWGYPLKFLLEIILGGKIPHTDLCYLSKQYGAEFRDIKHFCKVPITGKQASSSFDFLPLKNNLKEIRLAVSRWMQQPCALRGTAPLYIESKCGNMFAEQSFSSSMRLIEAVYTQKAIAEEIKSHDIPLAKDGIIDLELPSMREIKRIVKKLSNPKRCPFSLKLKSLIDQFGDYFEARGLIDWDSCISDCKNLRNHEAHGTLIGGSPPKEYRKMFVLEHLGYTLFEFAMFDLFGYKGKTLEELRFRAVKNHRFEASLIDCWPSSLLAQ